MTDTAHPGTKTPAPEKTTLDIVDIFHILPHRFPFLLIDRVIEIQPRQRIVAIKNVTINEPFFAGHFPTLPIMPGVLIVEAIAQAGGRCCSLKWKTGKTSSSCSLERAGEIPPAGCARRPVAHRSRAEELARPGEHGRRPHGGDGLRWRQARG